MFDVENAVLVIVDVQEKLTNVMHEKEKLRLEIGRLIKGIKVLEVPIILTEQNPKGLGTTIAEVKDLLPDIDPIYKMSFSCLGEEESPKRLKDLGRMQVILTGIETHVCVYQTAVDLVKTGYDVQVVADCVSSRTLENKELALEKMRKAGICVTSTEIILFELLKTADSPKFKEIASIIK
ncbi:hydrolase [Chloroflexota bacterium]